MVEAATLTAGSHRAGETMKTERAKEREEDKGYAQGNAGRSRGRVPTDIRQGGNGRPCTEQPIMNNMLRVVRWRRYVDDRPAGCMWIATPRHPCRDRTYVSNTSGGSRRTSVTADEKSVELTTINLLDVGQRCRATAPIGWTGRKARGGLSVESCPKDSCADYCGSSRDILPQYKGSAR